MGTKITTHQILKGLQILSWIIFIGLCIEAGAIAIHTFISLFISPNGVNNFWDGSNYLSSLYNYDYGHFFMITLTMTIVAVLKAIMFYFIIKLFLDKKLNLFKPFSSELKRFILNLSYFSIVIGLFSYCGHNYSLWLTRQGFEKADLQSLHMAGADVWLFMAVILFVIGQIIKRGVEIQNENDLTI